MKYTFNKILIIPNYDHNQKVIQTKYKHFLNQKCELIFFNWEQFYDLGDKITFQIYFDSIKEFLVSNADKNSIIIAEGISAAIVNSIEFCFAKKILISPVFAKSFVNPYTNDIPSYKPNPKNYILKIQKEYFKSNINYLNWDLYLSKQYDFYIEHYSLFDTIIAQFSLYENLKFILKNETKHLNNTYVLSGIYDKQSVFKKILKYSEKYHFTLIPFEYSSQHLIDEEKKYFYEVINNLTL